MKNETITKNSGVLPRNCARRNCARRKAKSLPKYSMHICARHIVFFNNLCNIIWFKFGVNWNYPKNFEHSENFSRIYTLWQLLNIFFRSLRLLLIWIFCLLRSFNYNYLLYFFFFRIETVFKISIYQLNSNIINMTIIIIFLLLTFIIFQYIDISFNFEFFFPLDLWVHRVAGSFFPVFVMVRITLWFSFSLPAELTWTCFYSFRVYSSFCRIISWNRCFVKIKYKIISIFIL